MQHRRIVVVSIVIVVVASLGGLAASTALAGNRDIPIKATVIGLSEVPAISTSANGTFTGTVSGDLTMISYTLSYSGFSSAVSAAHIHFAQPDVNGGIVAFLCGGGGKPVCPATSGSVSGTIVMADIQAVTTQGIAAGELGEVLMAMSKGATYVNVHSATFPGGEIRGQVVRG